MIYSKDYLVKALKRAGIRKGFNKNEQVCSLEHVPIYKLIKMYFENNCCKD